MDFSWLCGQVATEKGLFVARTKRKTLTERVWCCLMRDQTLMIIGKAETIYLTWKSKIKHKKVRRKLDFSWPSRHKKSTFRGCVAKSPQKKDFSWREQKRKTLTILVVFLITDLKLFRFSIRPNHLDDITPKMGVFRESIILSSQVLVNNQRVWDYVFNLEMMESSSKTTNSWERSLTKRNIKGLLSGRKKRTGTGRKQDKKRKGFA